MIMLTMRVLSMLTWTLVVTCMLVLGCTEGTKPQPYSYSYDYSDVVPKDTATPVPDVLIGTDNSESLKSRLDFEMSAMLKRGCHDDLDCFAGSSFCYNLNLFGDGKIDLNEDPLCTEVRPHEWLCYTEGEYNDCSCERMVCETQFCENGRCSWY